MVPILASSVPVATVPEQVEPDLLFVGHSYGEKPLLADDELDEGEEDPSSPPLLIDIDTPDSDVFALAPFPKPKAKKNPTRKKSLATKPHAKSPSPPLLVAITPEAEGKLLDLDTNSSEDFDPRGNSKPPDGTGLEWKEPEQPPQGWFKPANPFDETEPVSTGNSVLGGNSGGLTTGFQFSAPVAPPPPKDMFGAVPFTQVASDRFEDAFPVSIATHHSIDYPVTTATNHAYPVAAGTNHSDAYPVSMVTHHSLDATYPIAITTHAQLTEPSRLNSTQNSVTSGVSVTSSIHTSGSFVQSINTSGNFATSHPSSGNFASSLHTSVNSGTSIIHPSSNSATIHPSSGSFASSIHTSANSAPNVVHTSGTSAPNAPPTSANIGFSNFSVRSDPIIPSSPILARADVISDTTDSDPSIQVKSSKPKSKLAAQLSKKSSKKLRDKVSSSTAGFANLSFEDFPSDDESSFIQAESGKKCKRKANPFS